MVRLSPEVSGLARGQNIFGARFPGGAPAEIVDHWLWENGIYDWPETTRRIQFEINYNSHNWQLVRDPGSPYQAPEHMVICRDCGLEDMGHPNEFGIEYPNCGEIGN